VGTSKAGLVQKAFMAVVHTVALATGPNRRRRRRKRRRRRRGTRRRRRWRRWWRRRRRSPAKPAGDPTALRQVTFSLPLTVLEKYTKNTGMRRITTFRLTTGSVYNNI
jgi:hypothetical protein